MIKSKGLKDTMVKYLTLTTQPAADPNAQAPAAGKAVNVNVQGK